MFVLIIAIATGQKNGCTVGDNIKPGDKTFVHTASNDNTYQSDPKFKGYRAPSAEDSKHVSNEWSAPSMNASDQLIGKKVFNVDINGMKIDVRQSSMHLFSHCLSIFTNFVIVL